LALRCHAVHQQAAEILIAHLGDASHALLAAAGIGSGGNTNGH